MSFEKLSVDANESVIEVNRLTFAYPGTHKIVLNDVSFAITRGEIVGLLGPSGAGKSTLLRILTRQIRRVDSGTVSLFGKAFQAWNHKLYERIGVSFELPNHYPRLTAAENLRLFAGLYRCKTRPINEALELVGLSHVANDRVGTFSKGMQVRLNFARAILHNPELLYLDEPTSGLDPTTSSRIVDIILNLKREGKTIVITTHNMSNAERLCDRVGFIARGKLMILDQPEALKQRYGHRSVAVSTLVAGELNKYRFSLDGLAQNSDFLSVLTREQIHSIHSEEASLDDVFRQVTGEALRENEP